jgi:hypothetical protein
MIKYFEKISWKHFFMLALDFILMFCAFYFLAEPVFGVSYDLSAILMISGVTSLAMFIMTFRWFEANKE